MRFSVVLVLFFVLLGIACSQQVSGPAPKPDPAVAEKAIREADARWLKAAQARDAAGVAAALAADGVAYREHVAPLVGPAAFQAWSAQDFADNPKAMITWTTDAIHVADSGELAVQTGEYHMTAVGPKGDGEDRGRFVTVWRKVDGGWKVAHDIGSTTMPEPPPKEMR